MGNCQAIDAASLVIQHPCGKVDKLLWPVNACDVMKANPGHYVALLISSTFNTTNTTINKPVRVTRIKLLRPSDNLTLGQVYRLITAQDVMKGLGEKKQAKMKKALCEALEKLPLATTTSEMAKNNHHQQQQVTRHERHRQRSTNSAATATARPRTWQPSLLSITEATT